MKKSLLIGMATFALGAVVGLFLLDTKNDTVACPQDAKLCEDGSAVGRVGPSCVFAECPSVSPNETVGNFSRMGVITMNNPGQKEDVPYLIYEEPGAPALSVELVFTETSMCETSVGERSACNAEGMTTDVFVGERVRIEGVETNGTVSVLELVSMGDGSVVSNEGSFEVSIGSTWTLSDETTVTPREVVEDSRCPVDVVCIQAGTVRVRVHIVKDGEESEVVFRVGETRTVGEWRVTLAEVLPEARSTREILPEEYHFVFTFERSVD